MPEVDFAETGRVATALREGLRERAALPAFRPLDAAALTGAAPGLRRAGRWISLGVGVAAVGAAIALLWPPGLGGGAILATPVSPAEHPSPSATAVPSGTPSGPVAEGAWRATAPAPLSPRYDSIAVWADGTFLLAGGLTGQPCPLSGDCVDVEYLRDGVRYDPATDTWQPIADAPIGVGQPYGEANPYPAVAVLDRTVYLLSTQRLLAYHLDADRWEELPAPPEDGQLLATDSVLLVVPWSNEGDRVTYQSFDPRQATWTSHDVEETYRPDAVIGSAAVGDQLVIAATTATGNLWVGRIDVQADGRPARHVFEESEVPNQRPAAVAVGEQVAWPREGPLAWFLDPQRHDWSTIELPEKPGGLAGRNHGEPRDWYVTTDRLIALRGDLYDPVARVRVEVPALPLPADDPIVVGGGDYLLACYGQDAGVFADACYLLQPPGTRPPSEAPEVVPASAPPGTRPPSEAPEPTIPEPPSEAPEPSPRPTGR